MQVSEPTFSPRSSLKPQPLGLASTDLVLVHGAMQLTEVTSTPRIQPVISVQVRG